MTKEELIKQLEEYSDDTEIILWRWTQYGSRFDILNQTLNNDPNEGVFLICPAIMLSPDDLEKIKKGRNTGIIQPIDYIR